MGGYCATDVSASSDIISFNFINSVISAFFTSSGVITGFEKALEVSPPTIKNLTQEARDHVNSLEHLRTTQ